MIKVVLWDIDGTLLNFLKTEKYAIKKCFSIFGIGECNDEMIERYSKINKSYWEKLERGELTKPEVLRGRFETFFKSENIDFDRVDDFNAEYQFRLGDKFFFCDNGLEMVTALKGKVKQYAVTNGTFVAQDRKLRKSGLIDIFDDVFISDKIGFEKPSREFFEFIWSKIGRYNSDEVMIIGDSLTSDMRGGNNADILTCWYNPSGDKAPSDIRIDYDITDLSEIEKIINF